MEKREHTSVSRLVTQARCGIAYQFIYHDNLRIPPGIALQVGRGAHKGFEEAMRSKSRTGVDLNPYDVRDFAVASFDNGCETDDVLFTREEESRGKGLVLGESRDLVASLAQFWGVEVQPEYQPRSEEFVERKFSIELPTLGIDLEGRVDLEDAAQNIIDWKTTGKRGMTQNDVDMSIQITAYSMEHELRTGTPPSDIRVEQLRELKKGPRRDVIRSRRERRDYVALMSWIASARRQDAAGAFLPCPPGSWFCSPKYCGFFRTGHCQFINSERIAAEKVEND